MATTYCVWCNQLHTPARKIYMKLARETDAVYFTDMGQCQPAASLSSGQEENRWRLVPYRTSRLRAPIR